MGIVEDLNAALVFAAGAKSTEVREHVKGILAQASGDALGHAIRQACNSICGIPGNRDKKRAISEAQMDISRVERLALAMSN
jgi:hypothetical protein